MIIPVAVDGKIPIELAPELDVVRTVHSEVYSSRIRNSREEIGAYIECGPVEAEEL